MSHMLRANVRRRLSSFHINLPVSQLLFINKCYLSTVAATVRPRRGNFHKESRPPRSINPPQNQRTSNFRENNATSKLTGANAAKLQDSFRSLSSSLRSYEAKLFGDVLIEQNEKVTAPEIFEISNKLHKRILQEKDMIKVSEIKDTDTIYSDQCSILERLIYLTSTRPSDGGMMAEQLWRSFSLLKSDRDELEQLWEEKKSSFISFSVVKWITDIFVTAPGETEENSKAALARETRPESLFERVIYAISFEKNPRDRADRLASLLELSKGITLHSKTIEIVLDAYDTVGNSAMAAKAERIWRENGSNPKLLHRVLTTYLKATKTGKSPSSRSRTVMQMEKLVMEQWSSASPDNMHAKIISCRLVIEAWMLAGESAVPDLCARAEKLVFTCLGKPASDQIYNPQIERNQAYLMTNAEVQLLDVLVSIFANQKSPKRIHQAILIIQTMEMQFRLREAEAKKGRHGWQNEKPKSLAIPSINTYGALLNGICSFGMSDRAAHSAFRDLANYAPELLQNMAHVGVLPPIQFFRKILELFSTLKSNDSGERAADILSQMQMREIYDPGFAATIQDYHLVLRCWKQSASFGHPDAAEHASLLLRLMESRSGVHTGVVDPLGREASEIVSQVYNTDVKPDIVAYNLALQVCSNMKHNPNKERAAYIAWDIHNRLCQAGFEPNDETYRILYSCINSLLPLDSPKRVEIADDVLTLAKSYSTVDKSMRLFSQLLTSQDATATKDNK
jgi:hypothetical protein